MEIALLLIGGFVLLVVGGESLVSSAVAIAKRFNVPPVVIGATLVGFGTSTPELTTSLNAAFAGSPGIAIGNVVGSNIANILLILALVVLVRPIHADPKAVMRDGTFSVLAALALTAAAVFIGELSRPVGIALFAVLIFYVGYTLYSELRGQTASGAMHAGEAEVVPRMEQLHFAIPIFVVALAAVIFGADLLVDGAVKLARIAGLSELVIGLTIVAVGTSLPELVASLIAALKGRSDVALGNIFGSNVFNVFGILGLTAIVQPITIDPQVAAFDGWWMIGSAVALLVATLVLKGVGRLLGVAFLAAYAVYTFQLLQLGQVPAL
jgi:cation:H+ antiporter